MVVADLLRRGYHVSLPLSEDMKYDLVLDKGGRLLRVQCKGTRRVDGALRVKCKLTSTWYSQTRSGYKYTADDIDLLAVADIDSGCVYYIPAPELGEGRNVMHLRVDAARNGQSGNIRWAKD